MVYLNHKAANVYRPLRTRYDFWKEPIAVYHLPVQVFGGQVQWTTPIFIVVFSGTLHGTALPAKWPSSFGGGLLCGYHRTHRSCNIWGSSWAQGMAPFATQCSCSKSSSSACNSSSSACTATCCSTSESNATSNSFGNCRHLVRQPNIRQRIAQAGLIQNALARATTAAQAVPVGGVAQANIPLQMFALCPFDRTR